MSLAYRNKMRMLFLMLSSEPTKAEISKPESAAIDIEIAGGERLSQQAALGKSPSEAMVKQSEFEFGFSVKIARGQK